MKTFIVFLAFAVVFAGFSVFTNDSDNYVRLQKYLKALAEECASGGIWMLQYNESTGKYTVNATDAKKYAQFIAGKHFSASLYPLLKGDISVLNVERSVNKKGNECLSVIVQWKAHQNYRIMRLPFIPSPQIVTGGAIYEIRQ